MKCFIGYFCKGTLVAAVAGLSLASQAQIVNLSSGNSVAQVNPGSPNGMFSWVVDGIPQLNSQWFWYRVGSGGPERSIDTISAPGITLVGTSQLYTTYTSPLFSVRVDYLLNGGLAGSGASAIGETITINNLTGNTLDFHFFQYSDFNLNGTPNDTLAVLDRSLSGLYRGAFQADGISFTETIDAGVSPSANHGMVANYPVILGSLNDGNPTTLPDIDGPIGPGDLTFAFQWDLTIGPNGTAIISKTKSLQVPEPSAAALVALGMGAWVLRRRKN